MKYIAIVKTAKESDSAIHKGLPADYPTECKEFESHDLAEAKRIFPDSKVMSADEYRGYSSAMEIIFNHIKAQKPWWKFW